MTLYESICKIYPELQIHDFLNEIGTIRIQKDSDSNQEYIYSWEHPILQKPTDQQLKDNGYVEHQ